MATIPEQSTSAPRPTPRAESVGSLLRPRDLRDMFPKVYEGHNTPSPAVLDAPGRERLAELERLADTAVAEVVRRQIEIGLDVISDGEMRRGAFTHSLIDALDGFEDSEVVFEFTSGEGEVMVPPSGPAVGAQRVRKAGNPALREFEYVRSLTDYPAKVTFPAASYWYCEPVDLEKGAYASQFEFVEDVTEIQRQLLHEIAAAAGRYVQLDWPPYVMVVDPNWRDSLPGTEGMSLDQIVDRFIATDNAVLEGLPEGVTKAMHICRGNYRSAWMTEGSLEPLAERIFNELKYDRFLVEWEDTDREGDFSSLRHVPKHGPIIVMGVLSSKTPTVETVDELERRIEEAARYVDIDRLAISPQCGFASTWEGNEIDPDVQWRKLERVVEVADRIWGR